MNKLPGVANATTGPFGGALAAQQMCATIAETHCGAPDKRSPVEKLTDRRDFLVAQIAEFNREVQEIDAAIKMCNEHPIFMKLSCTLSKLDALPTR